MPSAKKSGVRVVNFATVSQDALPVGRKGKHHDIVSQLISDLEQLADGRAIKIPISELPDTKANVRSALNRATRKLNLEVVTSSDDLYFYVWRPSGNGNGNGFSA